VKDDLSLKLCIAKSLRSAGRTQRAYAGDFGSQSDALMPETLKALSHNVVRPVTEFC
jgi:hypothetical protein